jgi:hypothetical protein
MSLRKWYEYQLLYMRSTGNNSLWYKLCCPMYP